MVINIIYNKRNKNLKYTNIPAFIYQIGRIKNAWLNMEKQKLSHIVVRT